MEIIGSYRKLAEQGMWHMDLQSAEETICTGWLLYSAEEYDREALIWNLQVFKSCYASGQLMMEPNSHSR